MSRQYHVLKCISEYYTAIALGDKMFEVRKDDRGYEIGDWIWLVETLKITNEETGRTQGPFEITYILHGGIFGIEEGYCIMQLK